MIRTSPCAGGKRLTEATEFARLVGQRDGGGGGGEEADAGEHMDVDAPQAATPAVGAKRCASVPADIPCSAVL